jgi:hypothetical protein
MSHDTSDLEPNLEIWAGKELRVLGDLGVSTRHLASALAKEIESVCRVDKDGVRHAPDQFNLRLNADDAAKLAKSWGSLQSVLIQGLKANLLSAGYRISRRLHLSFSTDPTLGRGGIQVIAWHSGDPLKMEELTTASPAADVGSELPVAFLVVSGQQIFRLEAENVAIGRRLDNDLVIDNPRVSRKHALIQVKEGRFVIQDLHSTAGTLVNGRRIRSMVLEPGDVIRLAEAELVYGESPGEPPTKAIPYEGPPGEMLGRQQDTTLGTFRLDEPPNTQTPDNQRGSQQDDKD